MKHKKTWSQGTEPLIYLQEKPRCYTVGNSRFRFLRNGIRRKEYGLRIGTLVIWFGIWRINWSKLFPSYFWYKLSLTEMEAHYNIMSICSDPMNGCPDDFAEAHSRQYRGIDYAIDYLASKSWSWTKELFSILIQARYQELDYSYSQLPWIAYED